VNRDGGHEEEDLTPGELAIEAFAAKMGRPWWPVTRIVAGRHQRLDDFTKAEAVRLREEGVSASEIGRRLKISPDTVYKLPRRRAS
jgi:DNA invertase Pin-like site-specific DNA recombinase